MAPLTREECIGQPRRVWFGSCLDSPTFRITVGTPPTTKSFNIHEAFLTQSSPYFATLLSVPSFTESTSRSVVLSTPVDSIEAFEVLIEYMHSFDWEYTTFNKNSYWGILHTKVFLMAGRLCMDRCQKLALRKLSIGMVDSYRAPRTRWAVDDVVQIVDLTYAHTASADDEEDVEEVFHEVTAEDVPSKAPKAPAVTPVPDAVKAAQTVDLNTRLRILVAQFCASNVGLYKGCEAFRDVMEKYPEFVQDLLTYLAPGRNVDEIRDL